MAGTELDHIDLIETHDCFTVSEYLAYDHPGLSAPGETWRVEGARVAQTLNIGGSMTTVASFVLS